MQTVISSFNSSIAPITSLFVLAAGSYLSINTNYLIHNVFGKQVK